MDYNVILQKDSPIWHDIKKLSKKYTHVEQDFHSCILKLKQGKIPNIKKYPGFCGFVIKIRVKSQDIKRGKRGGFRLLCYRDPERREIYPLLLYAKPEEQKERIIRERIIERIRRFGLPIP